MPTPPRALLPRLPLGMRLLGRLALLVVAAGAAGLLACESSRRAAVDPVQKSSAVSSGARQAAGSGAAAAGPAGAATASGAPSADAAAADAGSAASGQAQAPDAGAGPYVLPAPVAVGPAPNPAIRLAGCGKQAARGNAGVVASVEHNATRIGVDVLDRGGNAVDAAVAVAFALAVTHPQAGSIGGGGFMIVRRASGETYAIDYRETSPAAANAETNKKMLAKGGRGYGSAAVPGVVAGLALAHEHFGSLPWAELVAPAAKLAREGHALGARQALVLDWHWKKIKDPTFRAIFGHGNKPLGQGMALKQPALATTLERIAASGRDGFYRGELPAKLERAMLANGGYLRATDLERYSAEQREPLRFLYRGFEVNTMPPPSMGGIALASIMLELEQSKAYEAEPSSALSLHWFAEAARRAYADRRSVAADPAFVDGSVVGPRLARLLDPRYYAERQPPIDPARATPSARVIPLDQAAPEPEESPETTHFSIVDAAGNAVACTTTLSGAFGALVVPPETGVILSNALGAFSSGGINAIAPGKRMASSMTPTIVVQDHKTVAVLGSPGGDTIPNTVAQVLRNLVDYHLALDEAVQLGRVHHQWMPDELRIEDGRAPQPAVVKELKKRGHKVVRHTAQGDANSILVDPSTGSACGYADPREGGVALAARKPGHDASPGSSPTAP